MFVQFSAIIKRATEFTVTKWLLLLYLSTLSLLPFEPGVSNFLRIFSYFFSNCD